MTFSECLWFLTTFFLFVSGVGTRFHQIVRQANPALTMSVW